MKRLKMSIKRIYFFFSQKFAIFSFRFFEETKNKNVEDEGTMRTTLEGKHTKYYSDLEQLHQKYISDTAKK